MDYKRLVWLLKETSEGTVLLDGHLHALCNDIYDYDMKRGYLSGKRDYPFHHGTGRNAPPYTRSVDFALRLFNQQLPGFSFSLHSGSKAVAFDSVETFEGVHEHLPLAICIAILEVLIARGPLRSIEERYKLEIGLFG